MELLEIKELRSSMCVFRNHKGLEVEYHGKLYIEASTDKRQKQFFITFRNFKEAHKVRTPTVKEVCSGIVDGKQVIDERKSTSGVYSAIKHLVAKGYLEEHLYRSVPYWIVAND